MTLQITALYAAILTLMYLALTYYVINGRVAADQSILHGDDMNLATKIRRHGNFAEFVPMALIVMAAGRKLGREHNRAACCRDHSGGGPGPFSPLAWTLKTRQSLHVLSAARARICRC